MMEVHTKTEDIGGVQVTKTYTNPTNLHNWDENPREIKTELFDYLVESLKNEGQLMPMLIDMRPEKEGTILGGNMTYQALTRLGWTEVWIEPRLPRDDNHAIEIALKHNANYGNYIEIKLQELAQKLKDAGFDLTKIPVPAVPEINLAEILARVSPETTEDEPPAVDETQTISQLGEVYQLGRHRLMCGDATKIEDVEKLMNGQKADMVFTDPPYGIDLDTDFSEIKATHNGWGKEGGEYDKIIGDDKPFNYKLFEWLECKEQFWWGANYYANTLPHLKSWFVWDKRTNDGENTNLDDRFGSAFEICWSKEKHKQDIVRKLWSGLFGTETQDVRNRVHPTQKPIELCVWFINKFSQPEQKVIDLFGGSGSTLIACEQTNRTCYMMELDPKYCDVIRKRYAKFIGKEESWQTETPVISQ